MTPEPTTSVPPSTRPWRRRMRVAWSVFFGLVTALLVVLWVRSYWHIDGISKIPPNGDWVGVLSSSGVVSFQAVRIGGYKPGWQFSSEPNRAGGNVWQVAWGSTSLMTVLMTPYWLLVTIASVCMALPWLSYRFSLRTLLIAMTGLAVVLGAVGWGIE